MLVFTLVGPTRILDVWVLDLPEASRARSPAPLPPGYRGVVPAASPGTVPELRRADTPALLYEPGEPTRNAPVVVNVHGGPESQSRPGFAPVTQYLLHRGYAVFFPNVRGSTGYGKA